MSVIPSGTKVAKMKMTKKCKVTKKTIKQSKICLKNNSWALETGEKERSEMLAGFQN